PAFVLSQDQTLAFNPLFSIGFTDQVQLIRNYCLLFAFFLFCIVFKVQCRSCGSAARISLIRLSPFKTFVNDFFEVFRTFFEVFTNPEHSQQFKRH
nr:hypothetical protein [Clostridia bacterium]